MESHLNQPFKRISDTTLIEWIDIAKQLQRARVTDYYIIVLMLPSLFDKIKI